MQDSACIKAALASLTVRGLLVEQIRFVIWTLRNAARGCPRRNMLQDLAPASEIPLPEEDSVTIAPLLELLYGQKIFSSPITCVSRLAHSYLRATGL